jgi:nicotinamidase-related amidase
MDTNKALLVIDIQMGLFEYSNPVHNEEQLLANINSLIEKARENDIPVIFIQHENDTLFIRDSDAWQLHPEIKPLSTEKIIHKAFRDAFFKTELKLELEQLQVGELLITGLVSEGCVKATATGALERGYKVVLVSDGHSSCSTNPHLKVKKWNKTLSERGAVLVRTEDVDFGRDDQ